MQNLNITIIQSNLHWENIDKNLEMFSGKISSITLTTDLIVLPEMFNTGFTMNTKVVAEQMNGKTMQWLHQRSLEKNCVVTGSIIISEKGKYYNRLIWMRPDGTHETYDKRHLFRMAKEDAFFTSGQKRLIVELNGWKLCPLICYDLRFPVWSRNKWNEAETNSNQLAPDLKSEYDVLIYIANWPERRSHPWKSLLIARAIENQVFLIGVNRVGSDGNNVAYSGDSVAINFKGDQLSKINPNEEGIETINLNYSELEKFRKDFPVGLDADKYSIEL